MLTIGDEVWIGVNTTIVGKVTIGDDVLIALMHGMQILFVCKIWSLKALEQLISFLFFNYLQFHEIKVRSNN